MRTLHLVGFWTAVSAVLALCWPPALRAELGLLVWAQRCDGPSNGGDVALATAVDANGNVYVTGSVKAGTVTDYGTIKYSEAGIPLWTNLFSGSSGSSSGRAIGVDGTDDVVVTGTSHGASGIDFATVKYSNAGVALWTNRLSGPGISYNIVEAMAIDVVGNVIVTGYATPTNNGSLEDFATVKYSATGLPLWTNRFDGPGHRNDVPASVGVDASGNVFVTGYSYANSTSDDYVTIKYSAAGAPLWTNRYDAKNDTDEASALAVDQSGDVYVTGFSSASFYSDYATIKYSSSGTALWTNRYSGAGNCFATAIVVAKDGSEDVFVTGRSDPTGLNVYDWATIRYSSGGTPLWTNRYNGPGDDDDQAIGIALDACGNVFVAGFSSNSHSSTDSAFTVIKYSGSGAPLWTSRYSGKGSGPTQPFGVATDQNGNVILTGRFYDGSLGDYLTLKYSSVRALPIPLEIQRTTSHIVLRWTNSEFTLQSAPCLGGMFTNVQDAASPYTNYVTAGEKYFRLAAP